MIKFILVSLRAYSIQTANLLKTDFITYSFWNVFQNLAVLKECFMKNVLGVAAF